MHHFFFLFPVWFGFQIVSNNFWIFFLHRCVCIFFKYPLAKKKHVFIHYKNFQAHQTKLITNRRFYLNEKLVWSSWWKKTLKIAPNRDKIATRFSIFSNIFFLTKMTKVVFYLNRTACWWWVLSDVLVNSFDEQKHVFFLAEGYLKKITNTRVQKQKIQKIFEKSKNQKKKIKNQKFEKKVLCLGRDFSGRLSYFFFFLLWRWPK